ncbi:MAG: D-inositol-3-phosphate glycosyltransferase [candidate division BRC1 bacterium ADurb.BinA364]|nr:MAG: D-inositol-3-phosphate glycosyltransferase [candidate division BRC1 bacterium ADurb.BinA364]
MRQRDFARFALDSFRRNGAPDLLIGVNAWGASAYERIAKASQRPLVLLADRALAAFDAQGDARRWQRAAARIERRLLRFADLVVCVSESGRRDLERLAGAGGAFFLPNDLLDLSPYGMGGEEEIEFRANGRPTVGIAANAVSAENALLIAQAAEILSKSELKPVLLLLGDGPGHLDCRRSIRQKGLDDAVRFDRDPRTSNWPRKIAAFDVAAAPFRDQDDNEAWEALQRAALARKPLICASFSRVAGQLEEGRHALFLRSSDAGDFARLILDILGQPGLARSLAENLAAWAYPRTNLAAARRLLARLEERGALVLDEGEAEGDSLEAREWRRAREQGALWRRHEAQFGAAGADAPPLATADEAQDGESETGENETALRFVANGGLAARPSSQIRYRAPESRLARNAIARQIYYARVRAIVRKSEREIERGWRRPDDGRAPRALHLIHAASDSAAAYAAAQLLLACDPDEAPAMFLVFGPKPHISPRMRAKRGLSVLRLPMELRFASRDTKIFSSIRKLQRLIERERIDVVHLHDASRAAAVRAAAGLARVPLVAHLHEPCSRLLKKGKKRFRDMDRAALAAAQMIAPTPTIERDAREALGAAAKIDLIPSGADGLPLWGRSPAAEARIASIRERAAGRPVVLFGGEARADNRLAETIEACRVSLALGYSLFPLMILDGGLESKRREAVRAFAQAFSPADAEMLADGSFPFDGLNAAGAIVWSAAGGACAPRLGEALGSGKPVIAIDSDASRDWIEPEATGLLCADDGVCALAASLRRCLRDEALARRLGEAGRASAARRQWRSAARQAAALYRSILLES